PVHVIDDNADTLQLFHRYLTGTRFDLTSSRDPEESLAAVVEAAPQAIVLDVMLPGVDGWELLGRLREHPQTRDIPVVICTILPQEKLASALGAAAFLQKPFTRDALFSVLAGLTRSQG
ncbi:MAG: response regulator, partial [Anaerolineae bacterium]|nr:response regulator [Anaerolineae bacterium]